MYDLSVTLLNATAIITVVLVWLMNVVVIVTFFSSLHLIHIQFNLVQAQTHTREKKRVRAFNAGLIYEIALFQLYAVI